MTDDNAPKLHPIERAEMRRALGRPIRVWTGESPRDGFTKLRLYGATEDVPDDLVQKVITWMEDARISKSKRPVGRPGPGGAVTQIIARVRIEHPSGASSFAEVIVENGSQEEIDAAPDEALTKASEDLFQKALHSAFNV